MADLMQARRRVLMGQPHQVTVSGAFVHFVTDMAAPLIITGTGNVTVCGKNIFDYANANIYNKKLRNDSGEIKTDSLAAFSQLMTPVKPGEVITASGHQSGNAKRFYFLDKNGGWIRRTPGVDRTVITYTIPDNCYFIQLQLKNVERETWDTVIVEYGSEATAFEAYNGTTLPAGAERVSLIGVNNVWSDDGSTITVTYWTH